ncbi:MAG: membrane protein insertase YidC [Deltaproteobacteria bacterium]|nr:membrane protein insertase YidC [Deltaproteobacteria bacterium]
MDSSALRYLLLGIAGVFIYMTFGGAAKSGSGERQPLGVESQRAPDPRAPEASCELWSESLHAVVRSRGGTLTRFELLTGKYRKGGQPLELSTTPDPAGDHEFRQPLFTRLRGEGPEDPAAAWNLDLDSVDYAIERTDGRTCVLGYRDARVEVLRTLSVTPRPYELMVETTITNRATTELRHALSIDQVAWRLHDEVEAKMFRISPYVTHVECADTTGTTKRLLPTEFEPEDFVDEPFARTAVNPQGAWWAMPGDAAFAGVSNAYFSQALAPISGPAAPTCLLQIEERWDRSRWSAAADDPEGGAMYRARLAYPPRALAPGESSTYRVLSFTGPKERDVLQSAGGGDAKLENLIDLGFFSSIAKVLVGFLLAVHGMMHNWGVAIIVLTFTARTLLFPLALPGIRNMIKMRELKPHMDELNARYKDDAQARGLAQMELWQKHGVNPLKGCFPQLASMPVWFALYTTLQTAVELYNTPFLWFPDLSQSDPLFILPFIIGATYFVQQKMMPMQGGDPVQQKMMTYFMPGMFTLFMLFLPAGLGVYMFTNSVLGITQQWLVEQQARRALARSTAAAITVTAKESAPRSKS